MYPSSTIVVPEFNHYFSKFLLGAKLNKAKYPSSVIFDNPVMVDNKQSFVRMLFDEGWPKEQKSYRYLYREETSLGCWPQVIIDRAMIYPTSAKYYVCDDDSTAVCNLNAFNLIDDDLTVLDALLMNRTSDSTALILTDSTAIIHPILIDATSSDSTAQLIVNFNKLTNLSKLVYIYLEFSIYQRYDYFNNETLISDPTKPLESCYEAFVMEKIFRYVADRGR